MGPLMQHVLRVTMRLKLIWCQKSKFRVQQYKMII